MRSEITREVAVLARSPPAVPADPAPCAIPARSTAASPRPAVQLLQLLPILAHLGLLLAVFKVFRVEGRAFQMLVAFALAALPVHYMLPYRWKKPCFVAVSIAGLAWVFGPAVSASSGLAALLIGVCYLPVAGRPRGPRGGVAAALALVGRTPAPRPRLARARQHVHVPHDHLPVRAEARPERPSRS